MLLRLAFGGVVGLAALGVTMTPAERAEAQALELRISGENPLSGLDLVMAQRFAENLEGELGDDFDHELFHTQALGDEVVHLQMIRSGQIDVYPMGSDAVELDEHWAVFDLPFLFGDRDDVARLLDGEVGELLRESMREAAGLEVLAFGELGFRQITNNIRPVTVPEDLDGIKIRVPGSSARVLTFETFGALPTTMNFSELYLALQQGTVDAQENPLLGTYNRSLFEVQEYLSLSNHVYTPVTLVMNGATFDSLSSEQQQLVKEAALEAAEHTRELGREGDERLLEELRTEGKVKINEIDLDAFRKASEDVYDGIAEMAGEDFVSRVIDAAEGS